MNSTDVTSTQHLIRDNLAFLRQGVALLRSLDDDIYCRSGPPLYESNVGAHFRHILDHYQQFANGVAEGAVDYDQRERDPHMESDRAVAIARLEGLTARLEALATYAADQPLAVRLNSSASSREEDLAATSSVGRELQFLVSHTVHHYALVAFILRSE
ncbi:MAG: DinB family protein, partial [Pseudomonadota bacterium]